MGMKVSAPCWVFGDVTLAGAEHLGQPGEGGGVSSLLSLCWHGRGRTPVFSVLFTGAELLLSKCFCLFDVASFQVPWLESTCFCWPFKKIGAYWHFWVLGFFSSRSGIYEAKRNLTLPFTTLWPRGPLTGLPSVQLSESLYVYFMYNIQGFGYCCSIKKKSASTPFSQKSSPYFLCKCKLKNIPQHWFSRMNLRGLLLTCFWMTSTFQVSRMRGSLYKDAERLTEHAICARVQRPHGGTRTPNQRFLLSGIHDASGGIPPFS